MGRLPETADFPAHVKLSIVPRKYLRTRAATKKRPTRELSSLLQGRKRWLSPQSPKV